MYTFKPLKSLPSTNHVYCVFHQNQTSNVNRTYKHVFTNSAPILPDFFLGLWVPFNGNLSNWLFSVCCTWILFKGGLLPKDCLTLIQKSSSPPQEALRVCFQFGARYPLVHNILSPFHAFMPEYPLILELEDLYVSKSCCCDLRMFSVLIMFLLLPGAGERVR